jgi:hypothetical protein
MTDLNIKQPTFNISLPGTLTIILLLLKAFKVISIGWIWVFAPLWISALIFIGIMGFLLFLALVAAIAQSL